jgi:hypothetical protein
MKIYKRILIASALMAAFAITVNGIAYIVISKSVEPDPLANVRQITMSAHEAESVLAIIGAEGFDNAFRHYAIFRDIGDHNFHELRRNYIAAADELAHYLNDAAHKNQRKH